MSLINDALKRAKESQKETPSSGSAGPFVPVEHGPRGGVNWTIFFIAVVLLAAAFLFIGMALAKHKAAPTVAIAVPTPVPQVVTVTQEVEKIVYKTASTVIPQPVSPATATTPVPVTAPPMMPTGPAVLDPAHEVSAPPPEPPPLPRLRVQAIFYDPQKPSAIINGRTVYLNTVMERENLRVKAILPSSVLVEQPDGTVKKLFLGE